MKDIIYVEHKHFISVRKNSFCFTNILTKEKKFIPTDEVEMLIVDNIKSYFSNQLITTCIQENIGVLFCDEKHSPKAIVTSDFGHFNKLERLESHLHLSQKTKSRLWRKIVISKINNQADCLELVGQQLEAALGLRLIGKQVVEGDTTNREAYAARRYFLSLFGKDFKRGRFDDIVNSSLNYSYSIIRSLIRRELAILGFEMSIGIHHDSKENPFNLSDDLIEPFRPFVDALVFDIVVSGEMKIFDLGVKKEMLQILFEKCVIDGKVYTITDAIKVSANSLVACFEKNSAAPLKLPQFIEVGK